MVFYHISEVDSKIRIEAAEIELFCKQQLRKNRKVGLAQILLHGSDNEIQSKVEEGQEERKYCCK